MAGSEPEDTSEAEGGAGGWRAARQRLRRPFAPPDSAALRLSFERSAPAVRRFLFGMCGDWHEAEDLAQEALLKAWQGRASFDGRAEIQTWIFTIARNHWLDRLRRRRGRPGEQPMDDQTGSSQATPAAEAARGELADAIARAVRRLPGEQREALALRESEGLTFRQIAELVGVPVATAKSRVRYALLKLAGELKPFRRELEP